MVTNKDLIRGRGRPAGSPNKKPATPRRPHRLVNGRQVPIKAAHSRRNAKPKVKYVFAHGASSAFLRDPLDARTRVGKRYLAVKAALAAHLGGDLTPPQEALVDQAARLGLLTGIAWAELVRAGVFDEGGKVRPALDVYLRTTKNHRAVLELLGLERKARDVTLQDVLQGSVERDE